MWIKLDPDEKRLKVTWGNSRGFYEDQYFIGPQSLLNAASTLRGELTRLSVWARSSDPKERWDGLRTLASAGSDLRYELFNDPDRLPAITQLEAWIAGEYSDNSRDLSIQADVTIQAPWGLVYDGEVPGQYVPPANALGPDEVAKNEMAAFCGFWALKYRLSATSSGERGPRASMIRPRKTFGLLSLVNKDVENQIEADLGESKYRDFCELLSPPVGVAHCLDDCRNLIDKTTQVDILFHFLGHHNYAEGVLDLGSGGKLSYRDFGRLLRALSEREYVRGCSPCGLLFVNGCESAVGDADFTLRRTPPALAGGMIATEARVRRSYAAQFGYRFLQSMLGEGNSVADTMDKLHHDPALWPESLLYGCYARPEYCIEKGTIPAAAPSAVAAGASSVATT